MVVMLVFAGHATASWESCYGPCFLKCMVNSKKLFSCAFKCLKQCVFRPASNPLYYCSLGCSMNECAELINGISLSPSLFLSLSLPLFPSLSLPLSHLSIYVYVWFELQIQREWKAVWRTALPIYAAPNNDENCGHEERRPWICILIFFREMVEMSVNLCLGWVIMSNKWNKLEAMGYAFIN